MRPHRQQPRMLPRPWDSLGKNTGVGCHFLLQCMKVKSRSCVRLFATPWTAAYQAPLSMGFSKQEYWSGVPLPSPSGPITSWQIGGETMGIVTDFIFLGSKITADGDCSHKIKRCLLLGRKAMTNIDNILKSRDITLPTKSI